MNALVILLLCLVMFTSGADMLIMTPILPQVANDLGVGVDVGGLWVTSYSIATAAFALIFGPISDRVGRKPILIAGIAVLAGGTAACGFAEGFTTMLVSRFVAGAGAGLLVTSTTSFVADHFPDEERAVVMGYVMSGFFLALILGVPLGAFLAGTFGWHDMFFVFTGWAALVALGLVLLPKPRLEIRSKELSIGGALRAYFELLKDRKVLGVLLMSAAIGASMTMFSVYTSPWFANAFGLDTSDRGLVYAVGGPAVLIGGPMAGRLSNRFGRVTLILAGSALMATMQLVLPTTPRASDWIAGHVDGSAFTQLGDVGWPIVAPALLCFVLAMLAGSMRSAPFQTLALEIVRAERRGALAAIRNTFNHGGSGIGAALGGAVWAAAEHPYPSVCLLAATLTVAGGALLYLLVGRDNPAV
ncbi:MAG: MFS transporter [Deltaproteobacteria bacterium]